MAHLGGQAALLLEKYTTYLQHPYKTIILHIEKHSSTGHFTIFHFNDFCKTNADLSKVKVNEGSENTSKCLSISSKRSVAEEE